MTPAWRQYISNDVIAAVAINSIKDDKTMTDALQ